MVCLFFFASLSCIQRRSDSGLTPPSAEWLFHVFWQDLAILLYFYSFGQFFFVIGFDENQGRIVSVFITHSVGWLYVYGRFIFKKKHWGNDSTPLSERHQRAKRTSNLGYWKAKYECYAKEVLCWGADGWMCQSIAPERWTSALACDRSSLQSNKYKVFILGGTLNISMLNLGRTTDKKKRHRLVYPSPNQGPSSTKD